MALSPIEIGAIGGLSIFIVKESFSLVGKIVSLVGKIVNKKNGKEGHTLRPGHSDACIKHGEKLIEHDTAIKQLCREILGTKDQMERIRVETKQDFGKLYAVLDDIKNGRK